MPNPTERESDKHESYDTEQLSIRLNRLVLSSFRPHKELDLVIDELVPIVAEALKKYFFYNVDHVLTEALKFRPDFYEKYKDPTERQAFYTNFYRRVTEILDREREGSDKDVVTAKTREALRHWCQ